MPTILRVEGFRFFFFSNEGTEPPHIHVELGAGHAKYWLEPVALAGAKDLKNSELGRAKLLVIQHRFTFLERWREHFGA